MKPTHIAVAKARWLVFLVLAAMLTGTLSAHTGIPGAITGLIAGCILGWIARQRERALHPYGPPSDDPPPSSPGGSTRRTPPRRDPPGGAAVPAFLGPRPFLSGSAAKAFPPVEDD